MSNENEWVITPGLERHCKRFIAHLRAAKHDPVLISGPRGVGKSLFLKLAEAEIQKESVKKIVTINCAHYQDTDIARSELFGHVRGAYTGADKDKIGHIEEANGGILILEEVGALSKGVQAKLLTFIESGSFYKVGASKESEADVQIIAATNDQAAFRADFKDRFFEFKVPPLHARRGDILYYLGWFFPDLITELTSDEVMALLSYHWPGNIRELMQAGKAFEKERIFDDMQGEPKIKGNFDYDFRSKYTFNKFQDTAIHRVLMEDLVDFWDLFNRNGGAPEDIEKAFDNKLSIDSQNFKILPKFKKEDIQSGIAPGGFTNLLPSKLIEDINLNFLRFCILFFRDFHANQSVLSTPKQHDMLLGPPSPLLD
ncbi:MAG: sigma 54-interacting transcriptional regulator, partial [Desulfobia sp.]